MVSEETPQGAPDRVLLIHVEPLFDEVVQGLYVGDCQGHAETFLIGFVSQRRVHLRYYLKHIKAYKVFGARERTCGLFESSRASS